MFWIACDKGSYGNDCKKTCGQCRETDQCRITDGRCLTGCDAGYQGDFCTESVYTMHCNSIMIEKYKCSFYAENLKIRFEFCDY